MRELTEVNWMDMCVDNPAEVVEFYEAVLDLKSSSYEEKEGRKSYMMHNEEGEEILGICDINAFENWVRGWVPYIEVDDFSEKVARIESLGGIIKKEGQYQSEGQQRFCLLIDPSGSPLMLHERLDA